MWESHDVIGQWFCCAVQGSRLRSQGSKLELVESESLWLWAKTFLPTDLMWSWLVGTITQTDSNPIMWWIQLRECFLSQSNRKECHAMCECVCVCVTSLWSPSGSIWVWINIYRYYIRTVLTIQTITSAIWRDKVFPSQLLPIPLSSCDWAATQLAKHPPVVGDDSPRQTAHVNWWGAWLIFWELIS